MTMMDTITILVNEDKKLAKDPEIGEITLKALELFGNNEQIVYQDTFHKLTFLDHKNSAEIFLSVASRFQPDNFTDQQLKDMGQIQESQGKSQDRAMEGLLKKDKQQEDISIIIEEKDGKAIAKVKREEENIDPELFNLNLATLPQFINCTRGVLMVRPKDLDMPWDEKTKGKASFYLLFKANKMMVRSKSVQDPQSQYVKLDFNLQWGDAFGIKIHDPSEYISVKLCNEVNHETLAEGTLILKDIFVNTTSWKKTSSTLVLTNQRTQTKFSLNLDFQYRNSKFTRIPRGKLEVILLEGVNLKYKNESYSNPIMEFRIESQRLQIKEEVNPVKANWKQKLIVFESSTVWDMLEIRFYDNSVNHNLVLLGAYQRTLNSIYFDDNTANSELIDLSHLNENLSGQIRLQFDFYPQKESLDFDKTNIQIPKGMQTRSSASPQRNTQAETNGQAKQSQTPSSDEFQLNMNLKKRGVCYLTLQDLILQGLSADDTTTVDNIRIEISYGDQKCLSRVTTDLCKTQNRELMDDLFRIALDDITISRGPEIKKIMIRAYDIDYSQTNPQAQSEVLVGETFIDPTFLRLNQGQEIYYQCSLILSQAYFLKKQQKTNDNNLLGSYKGGFDDEKEIMDLLDETDYENKQQQSMMKRTELLINFQILYLSTNFTRNSCGLITINDLTLLNLQNYLSDISMRDSGNLYLMFKMNGNDNNTNNAKQCKNQALIKEQICLFNQEYDPVDVMKCGRVFYVNSKQLPSFYQWQKQIVLFSSSPLDQLEIELIVEKKVQQVHSIDTTDPKDKNSQVRQSQEVVKTVYKKIILANVILNMADISYFLDQSATREISLANLMDFQGPMAFNPDSYQAGGIGLGASQGNVQVETVTNLKLQRLVSSKDLMNKNYQRNLILLMDIKFSADVFQEGDQVRGVNKVDHIFTLPKEIKYDDFINQGFDEWLKQNKPSPSFQKSNLGSIQGSIKSPSFTTKNQGHRHMLVELWLINLNSILRHIAANHEHLFGFLVFEPLSSTETVDSYMRSAARQVQGSFHQTDIQNLIKQQTSSNPQQNATNKGTRRQSTGVANMNQGYGQQIEDFFAQPEFLLNTETQITEVIEISDFEIHSINEMLEAWVPIDTNKVMLSLIVQQTKTDQLQKFRELFMAQNLSRSNNLLGLFKSGHQTGIFSNLEVYQCPIDFKQSVDRQEPSIQRTFVQCQNLAELSAEGHLLQNPISRAQCVVKTRLQTSRFIDTPSGYLNVVIKKMSHNSLNFHQDNFIRLELKSKVDKSCILVNSSMAMGLSEGISDIKDTEKLGGYKKRTEKNNKTVVFINEVANFVARHFSDRLQISIYNKSNGDQEPPVCLFTTKVELNNLELNDEKITILVVGTNAMRNKGTPIYYTFELDLLFNVRLQTDPELQNFEYALMNYKLLKGSEKLNRAEEQVLRMLLERAAFGKMLLPYRIKLRKCFFILRNMIKTSYFSIDQEKVASFRVNPKSFFFNQNDIQTKLSPHKQSQLVEQIKNELKQGRIQSKTATASQSVDMNKYKNMPLEKNSLIEKSNILVLEFKSNISFQPPQQAPTLTLNKTSNSNFKNTSHLLNQSGFANQVAQKIRYRRLVIVATQDQNTIMKMSFNKDQMVTGCFLMGQKIMFRNVQYDQNLTLRILIEEESDTTQKTTANQDKLTTLGIYALKISSLDLKTWIQQERTITISQFNIQIALTLIYSDFTKNPHKVVHFNFHRLIKIMPEEIQRQQELTQSQQVAAQLSQKGQITHGDNQSYKIVIQEDPIIMRQTVAAKQNQLIPALQQNFNKTLSSFKPQPGSINSVLDNQNEGEGTLKFKLLMEFENCVEYEGEIKDSRVMDIDEFGKQMKPEISKLTINNTKAENLIVFKLCVDNASQQIKDDKAKLNSLVVIAQASLSLAEIQTLPNQNLNFLIPIHALENFREQLSSAWALKNYLLENLYVLGSVKITDKTFGELSINVDKFCSLGKSLTLRDVQWKVSVKPASIGSQYLLQSLLAKETQPKDIFSFTSQRIPYDINLSSINIARDLVIQLQLKDIFCDQETFLRPSALQMFQDQDTFLEFEFIGFDDKNFEYTLGFEKVSMISMIQQQMLYEREKARTKDQVLSQSQELKQKQIQNLAEQKIETDFQECSAKFQRLFKDTYVKFNQTKEDREKKKLESLQGFKNESNQQANLNTNLNIPEGFQLMRLKPKPPSKEEESQLQTAIQSQLKDFNTPIDMIVKINWNFKYLLRAKHSDQYHTIKEEIQELERIKQRKSIPNLLETLEQVRSVGDLISKNLKTLALVLASESCLGGCNDIEEIMKISALVNCERIIRVLAELFKENLVQGQSLVHMMRALTYLKILSQVTPQHSDQFKQHIKKSLLIESMIETYQNKILDEHNSMLSSKSLALEFLTFLSNMLGDFSDIYFEMISGVRLEPLLAFVIGQGKEDYQIVSAYAKFINAVGQCLFKFNPVKERQERDDWEKRTLYVKMDLIKIAKTINDQLINLISGGLSVYKNDYEVLTQTICESALQFTHLALMKSSIVTNDESFTLPDILLNLFKILVDGIISQLSLDFITELKKRLNYEIAMIKTLDLRQSLLLLFDDGILIGMMKRLTEHFHSLLKMQDYDKKIQGFKFFEKTKLIFEFYATSDFALVIILHDDNKFQNAFGENCRSLIKTIITDPQVEDHDFVLFLHNVVKKDAEIESENGDQTQTLNKDRQAKFVKEKYGTLTKVNKFSISHIEWMETLYEKDY